MSQFSFLHFLHVLPSFGAFGIFRVSVEILGFGSGNESKDNLMD